MNLVEYIQHPEKLDAASLEALQGLVQRYPDFPAARLLLLRNLYQLHHESFGEELRRAALYVPSRRALFQLLESHNYVLEPLRKRRSVGALRREEEESDRTQSLINTFLSTLPEEQPRRLVPADAATDYMAYLLQTEADARLTPSPSTDATLKRQDLIDDFLGQDGRIVLSDAPDDELQAPPARNDTTAENEDYFTETLARIYIKQGKYHKALEIIRRLSLKYPKKNRYFADQIRFLTKVIINNNHNK